MRRMLEEQEDVFYYVTVMNENYAIPPCRGRRGRHPQGHVPLRAGQGTQDAPQVQLLGSGTILREVLAAAELLEAGLEIAADVWSVTSFTELRRDGMASSAGTACTRTQRQAIWVEQCLAETSRPGHRRERLHARASPT